MTDLTDPTADVNPVWLDYFSGRRPELRRWRWVLRLLSPDARDRCRLCYAGFDGFSAPLMRAMGRGPWLRNPHYCEKCETWLVVNRGGVETEVAMLYADVRGSTQLAASMRPAEFAALMQRFFETAMKTFTWSDAIMDKMVGDEVIGIYVPGITGSDYRERAINAGLNLLRATGHAEPTGPWLSIGVGVHSGKTFIGSIGIEGGSYQFAALGDAMNFCARLVAAANGGEVLVSEEAWSGRPAGVEAVPRDVDLKGYPAPVRAYAARVG